MKLSQRLQAIADFVDKGSCVGDIGTDHGQLPCYLVEEGIALRVVAGDINALPLAGAQKRITELGLDAQISTRLGNGLSILEPGEVEVVTISGMGGSLMTDILHSAEAVVSSLKQLVLQPNLAAHLLRRWAMENEWHIEQEKLLYEEGRYYVVMALRPGAGAQLSEAELRSLEPGKAAGVRRSSFGAEALVERSAARGLVCDPASIEDIMLYFLKGESK